MAVTPTTSKRLGHNHLSVDRDLNKSLYHCNQLWLLDVEQNRIEQNRTAELGITTAQLPGSDVQELRVDRLLIIRIS